METMNDFMSQIENSMERAKIGELITGTILSVNETELVIDISKMADAVMPRREATRDQDAKLTEMFKVGDSITAVVVKGRDEQKRTILSLTKIEENKKIRRSSNKS